MRTGTSLKRAEKYQPESELGSVSVNLALFMSGRGNELPQFKQFGTRGLILPNIKGLYLQCIFVRSLLELGMNQ